MTVANGAIYLLLAAGFASSGEQLAPQELAGIPDATRAPALFVWELARRYPAYVLDTAVLIVGATIVRSTVRRFRQPRRAGRPAS